MKTLILLNGTGQKHTLEYFSNKAIVP